MTYKGIQSILAEFYKRLKNDPNFKLDIISKLSENVDSKLFYDGKELSTTKIQILTKTEYESLDIKDNTTLYVISDTKNPIIDLNSQITENTNLKNQIRDLEFRLEDLYRVVREIAEKVSALIIKTKF